MNPTLSVIVTTYQRPDALAATLRGLGGQNDDDFEVIVADDGSEDPTRMLVESANTVGPLAGRVVHAWQPDDGFRAARARNLAVSRSRGDILVMLDGDCVPRPGFVRAQRRCRPGVALRGSRCLLSESATERVLADGTAVESMGWGGWLRMKLAGDVNRLPQLAGTPIAALGRRLSWRTFRTCNAAVHRRDFAQVDGFDHAFRGWGYEDSDLAIRLAAAGVVIRGAAPAATVVHLWHREADRTLEGENRARLDEVRTSGRIRAVEGLSTIDQATPR